MLRGAKAIADKIDLGCILLSVKDEDLVALDKVLNSGVFDKPTLKLSIYKKSNKLSYHSYLILEI